MKRAFIIHGWGGYPGEAWFPWLKRELEACGFHVEVPAMPEAANPKIERWVPHLAKIVGQPDAETYLIGHSIGVQTILRFLQTIDTPIAGVVSVAGWFTLIPGSLGGTDNPGEDEAVAAPWLNRPIDTEKAKQNAGPITAIFSDDDPFVGLENVKMFQERLGAKTLVLKGKGHLNGETNVMELPEVLEAMDSLVDISLANIN